MTPEVCFLLFIISSVELIAPEPEPEFAVIVIGLDPEDD